MVSVIIPCYNYGHLIADSINSIIKQTFSEWELIVVDDGSTDNTREVVTKFAQQDARIFYIPQENAGLAASRNKGLQYIKGEYVQFLDADDLIEPHKFEKQVELFNNNPEADVVYSSVRYFRTDPYNPADRLYTYWGENKEWMPRHSGRGLSFLEKALKAGFLHLSSPLFRRSVVDRAGLYDSDFNAVADYHFILKCVIADEFFLYHDTPGTYSLVRWHPDNMSKNLQLMQSNELRMRKKLAPLLEDYPEAQKINTYAIKSFRMRLTGSWKTKLLSGGGFDFLKLALRFLRLESVVKKIFYI